MKSIICPNCDGKGHVLDGFVGMIFFPLALFERNEKRGITRTRCDHCGGTGLIEIEED